MKKLFFSVLLLALSTTAHAVYVSPVYVQKIVVFSSGIAHLKLTKSTASICTHWGYNFRFNATTDGGKNLLKYLTLAKLDDLPVALGYSASTAPNTDHNNGCTTGAMARVTTVVLE